MWKVKCDCCGQIEDGNCGEAILPNGWYTIRWNCEGRNVQGMDNPDNDTFILCVSCIRYFPRDLNLLHLDVVAAIDRLKKAYGQAKGFGNQGNAAASHIEYALEYLGVRMH